MGTESESDTIGVAVQYADAAIVDTKRIGTNLREHGLHALTKGRCAGNELHHAVSVYRDRHHLRRTEPAFLHEDGETYSNILAFGPRSAARCRSRPIGKRQSLVDEQWIVAGIENDLGLQGR